MLAVACSTASNEQLHHQQCFVASFKFSCNSSQGAATPYLNRSLLCLLPFCAVKLRIHREWIGCCNVSGVLGKVLLQFRPSCAVYRLKNGLEID